MERFTRTQHPLEFVALDLSSALRSRNSSSMAEFRVECFGTDCETVELLCLSSVSSCAFFLLISAITLAPEVINSLFRVASHKPVWILTRSKWLSWYKSDSHLFSAVKTLSWQLYWFNITIYWSRMSLNDFGCHLVTTNNLTINEKWLVSVHVTTVYQPLSWWFQRRHMTKYKLVVSGPSDLIATYLRAWSACYRFSYVVQKQYRA